MTPERKQWWDSLPQREKMLREQSKKCGGTFENFGQPYCCWCGRKIVEVNNK